MLLIFQDVALFSELFIPHVKSVDNWRYATLLCKFEKCPTTVVKLSLICFNDDNNDDITTNNN